uniref:Putative secreted protein n=1 Tax=Anopheles marajoara TaxID=58244 RepID=A0A2M4C5L1_9DIPT
MFLFFIVPPLPLRVCVCVNWTEINDSLSLGKKINLFYPLKSCSSSAEPKEHFVIPYQLVPERNRTERNGTDSFQRGTAEVRELNGTVFTERERWPKISVEKHSQVKSSRSSFLMDERTPRTLFVPVVRVGRNYLKSLWHTSGGWSHGPRWRHKTINLSFCHPLSYIMRTFLLEHCIVVSLHLQSYILSAGTMVEENILHSRQRVVRGWMVYDSCNREPSRHEEANRQLRVFLAVVSLIWQFKCCFARCFQVALSVRATFRQSCCSS